MFVCPFFNHCIIFCPPSIYVFWLSLWYFQTLLTFYLTWSNAMYTCVIMWCWSSLLSVFFTLFTLREFTSGFVWWGPCCYFSLVFCLVLLCVFTNGVTFCDVCYDFRIKTMFCSSLPAVVCKRAHNVFFLRLVYPM